MMMMNTSVLILIINIITPMTIGARVLSSVHRVWAFEFGTVGLQALIGVLGLGLWALWLSEGPVSVGIESMRVLMY